MYICAMNFYFTDMRRCFFAFLLICGVSLTGRAFTVVDGDGHSLSGAASLVLDFSGASVGEIPLDEYLSDIGESEDFEYEICKYYSDFINRFNERSRLLMLTRTEGKPFTLTVRVMAVNQKGNEATCEYVFSDTGSGQVLLIVSGRTREGRIGSFSNLVGDVIREAGGDFGSFMSRYLKNKNKSKNEKNSDPVYE